MSKIRNWIKHPTGVDVWCHSEKQVMVTVEMQEERDFPHGDYYHAFAWGTVPPNTIGTGVFAVRPNQAGYEVIIADWTSYNKAQKSAISWMRAHPGGGIRGAYKGRYW